MMNEVMDCRVCEREEILEELRRRFVVDDFWEGVIDII